MAGRRGALSLGWTGISRQLGTTPAVVVSLFVAALIATFLLAAGPRLLEVVSEQDLQSTVSDPPPAQRNIRVERQGRIGSGPPGDPFRPVRQVGDAFLASEFPPSVAAVVTDHKYLVDSPRFVVSPRPGEQPPHPFPIYLRYRHQEDIDEHIELIEGELPRTQEPVTILVGAGCPTDPEEIETITGQLETEGPQPDLDCALQPVPHFQVAVSAATAAAMGIDIGQQMVLTPDPTDGAFFGMSNEELDFRFVMSISGIIQPDDIENEYWYGDPGLHQPAIRETADFRFVYATGLMNPDDYAPMFAVTGEAGRSYVWRYFVDPGLVAASDLEVLQTELNEFLGEYAPQTRVPTDFVVATRLSDLLASHEAQRSQTVALMSLSVAGLFATVVTVIVVLAVLMTRRQHAAITLTRGRGASTGQLVLTRIYEGFLIVTPAVAIGYFAAGLALPGTDSLISSRITFVFAVTVIAALVLTGLGFLGAPLGRLTTTGGTTSPVSSTRRAVAEVTIVVLATGAVMLLRRRGQTETQESAGFDLLLALAPTLVALALALIVVRIYPGFVRLLAWIGSKARGLVAFIGFRRIQRIDFGAQLPVLVTVVCVATAVYASTLQTSIESGQIASSWQEVGGDYAVKGFDDHVALPVSIDFDTLAPDAPTAMGWSIPDGVAIRTGAQNSVYVLAVEATKYQDLTRGTAGDIDLPSFLLNAPTDDLGSEDNPLPVIVADTWSGGFELVEGDTLVLNLGTRRLSAVVGQTRSTYPDVPSGRPFVVLDLDQLNAAVDVDPQPTVAYLAAPAGDGSEMSERLAAQAPSARLISRYEYLAEVGGDPFIAWADLGLGIVFWAATVFAVVSAVSALSITAATRRRDLAYLSTTGLNGRQALVVTLLEHLPAVVVGTIAGVGTGILAALALEPAIDLGSFTGGLVPSQIVINSPALVTIAVLMIGVLTAAVVMFVLLNRGRETGSVLRAGDET